MSLPHRRSLGAVACAALAPLLLGATGLTTRLEDRLLAAHNRERATLGLPPVAWNDALAASARGWADHLAATGAFDHYRPNPVDPDPQGENLWAGTRGYYTPEAMVDAWAEEKRYYRPGRIPDISATGQFADVGHYTQLVWKRTAQVGCAVSHSAAEDILVCRYSEGGNVIGERAF